MAVMSNLNLIVDLGSFADARCTEGTAINGGTRPDLDIRIDLDPTELSGALMSSLDHAIAEAKRAERCARVD